MCVCGGGGGGGRGEQAGVRFTGESQQLAMSCQQQPSHYKDPWAINASS